MKMKATGPIGIEEAIPTTTALIFVVVVAVVLTFMGTLASSFENRAGAMNMQSRPADESKGGVTIQMNLNFDAIIDF